MLPATVKFVFTTRPQIHTNTLKTKWYLNRIMSCHILYGARACSYKQNCVAIVVIQSVIDANEHKYMRRLDQ